jgi:hypothetical protein
MKYEHKKQLIAPDGTTVHMKSLYTIHGKQFVEVYETSKRFEVNELKEIEK